MGSFSSCSAVRIRWQLIGSMLLKSLYLRSTMTLLEPATSMVHLAPGLWLEQ
jgi:hypothetical protein